MQVDTNSTFQNNPNNASVNAPDNMSDFMSQAQKFVQKAQDSGTSPTAIANTIRFMYSLTAQNIQNKEAQTNTPSQQTQGDVAQGQLGVAQGNLDVSKQAENRLGKGTMAYNSDTGQYYNTLTGDTKSALPEGGKSAGDYLQKSAPNTSTGPGTGTNTPAPKKDIASMVNDPSPFDQKNVSKNMSMAADATPGTWKPAKFGGLSLTAPTFAQLQAQYPAAPQIAQAPQGPTNAQVGAQDPNSWQSQYMTPAMGGQFAL